MFEMNNEKRIRCHLEGLSASEIPARGKQTTSKCCLLTTGEDHLIREQARAKLSNLVDECLKRLKGARKISGYKCRDCNNETEQKAYHTSAKRDLYAHSPNGSRLKMTMVICFALLFTLATTAESRAEVINCVNGKYDDGTTCEKCGKNCDWSFDTVSGKLSVTGSGKMYNYSFSTDSETNAQYTTAPWKIYQNKIKSVKVEGLSTIGSYAFCHSGGKLTAVEMSDTVTDINQGAFAWNSISTVKLSDSLKSIGYIAFRGSSSGLYPTLIVPDTLETIGTGSLGTSKNTIQNTQIICLGDEQSCARVKNLFNEYKHYGIGGPTETLELAGNVVVANYEQCSGSYFWNGASCVREPDVTKRKCCDSCKDMGGWCNRIRYTPAEAAKVLTNDNNNSVTITFRK